MKKIFLLTLIFTTILMHSFSQLITPALTTEQCPGVNITFTVTIAAQSIQSVQPKALNVNPTVIQQPFNTTVSGANITFSFVGRFADNNNKQTFTVFYTDANNQSVTWDATYIKIKSLLLANSFSQIFPAPASITAQRCQIQNFPISFANVQYGNPFEAPAIGYGIVTNYEYLLPNGWSLNGNISNGSTWIAGSNSATVTSDLSNGVNGAVRIRPTNTACATGLSAGQEAVISINRPAPTLTITGTQDYICNVGQTTDFTMNGMPSGSTIIWQLSDPSVANIVGCNTCPTVTVQKTANVTGFVNLTATVSHCTFTYSVGPKQIALGTGRTTVFFTQLDVTCEAPSRPYFYGAVESFTSATNYQWYAKDMSNASNPFVLKNEGSPTADFPFGRNKGNRYYTIKVIATTPCGTVSTIENEGLLWVPSCVGGNQRILVSPNPVNSSLNISFKKVDRDEKSVIDENIQAVEVRNKTGLLVLIRKFSKDTKKTTINVNELRPDVYILSIWNGKEWISEEFIKQ